MYIIPIIRFDAPNKVGNKYYTSVKRCRAPYINILKCITNCECRLMINWKSVIRSLNLNTIKVILFFNKSMEIREYHVPNFITYSPISKVKFGYSVIRIMVNDKYN